MRLTSSLLCLAAICAVRSIASGQTPTPATSPVTLDSGCLIDVGTLLGHVGEHEVRSPFRGVLQSFIAVDTERVTPRQPIAWLRSD